MYTVAVAAHVTVGTKPFFAAWGGEGREGLPSAQSTERALPGPDRRLGSVVRVLGPCCGRALSCGS